MKDLIIFGNGEFAQIAFEYFTYDAQRKVKAFVVNQAFIKENVLCDIPVIPYEHLESYFSPNDVDAFIAVPSSGLNQIRKKFFYEFKAKGFKLATYVSSKAFFWRNAKLGENCFVFENNVIQPFVEIGDNVILWSGNHIGHRTIIGSHCFLTSHVVISGYCKIGDESFLGVNSTFNDKTGVGARSIVGSGSLVTKYLEEEDSLYIGSPAKKVIGRSPRDISL